MARRALKEIRAMIFAIPPSSIDLYPIENFYHLINVELKNDTISRLIQSESFEQFSGRARRVIMEFPSEKINNIIDSMDRRIGLVMKATGSRINLVPLY